MSRRATGATMAVVTGAVVGALVSQDSRLVGAIVGGVVGVVVAFGLAVSLRPSKSERAFMAQHGWMRSEEPDAVAAEALAGRIFVGRGRNVIVGEWRGREATRFLVSLDEGVNSKEIWIEGVFVDGHMPQVDIIPRGRLRRRPSRDVSSFARAWHVYSPDVGFATELLHDPMKTRLMDAPSPRRAVYFGGGFVGVRNELGSQGLGQTSERLDFASDLADLIPRRAWDYLFVGGEADGDTRPVSRDEYARSPVGLPASSPLVVAASSAPSASLKRVFVTVVAVVALSAVGLWMLTI